jgi:hypothetical protein
MNCAEALAQGNNSHDRYSNNTQHNLLPSALRCFHRLRGVRESRTCLRRHCTWKRKWANMSNREHKYECMVLPRAEMWNERCPRQASKCVDPAAGQSLGATSRRAVVSVLLNYFF